ncbi:MAG: hypothetical protein JRN53_00460 [Nitrososphaerota archaeon]|jgi:translation initiation factor 2B subunit (eIF-2B alpha/beta/delta family)|nr:hypothetical protein [Nitrososphaerota archaeon]MDG7046049.1 hypothetical protein [Nitrososphaerota archaeon]
MVKLYDILSISLSDKKSSATTIAFKMLDGLLMASDLTPSLSSSLDNMIDLCREKRPAMPILSNILKQVRVNFESNHDGFYSVNFAKKQLTKSIQASVNNTTKLLGRYNNITTISYSSNVKASILAAERRPKVIVIGSKPGREGEVLSRELNGEGIEAKLHPNSLSCYSAHVSEALIMGADAFFQNGFWNKIGSRQLALCFSDLEKEVIISTITLKLGTLRDDYYEFDRDEPTFEYVPFYRGSKLVTEKGIQAF